MPSDDLLERKRELHSRIARSRRRIDRRLRALADEGRTLVSWRTHVTRHPAMALAAALGAGLTASSLLRPKRVARWLGDSLLRQAMGGLRQTLWDEFRQIVANLSEKK